MLILTAKKRDKTGKQGKRLLPRGEMRAVVYGPTESSLSVTLNLMQFQKVLQDAGESSVIELTGLEKPLQVLIHEVDRDPITSIPRHADLYAIEKGAQIEIAVPLVFIGESPAVKAGANLVKILHELDIKADPVNLPHELLVDVSVLAVVGDQITVKDLMIPSGVLVKENEEQVVALIQAIEIEEEMPAVTEPDMAAIEVEKKGKTEEEKEKDRE